MEFEKKDVKFSFFSFLRITKNKQNTPNIVFISSKNDKRQFPCQIGKQNSEHFILVLFRELSARTNRLRLNVMKLKLWLKHCCRLILIYGNWWMHYILYLAWIVVPFILIWMCAYIVLTICCMRKCVSIFCCVLFHSTVSLQIQIKFIHRSIFITKMKKNKWREKRFRSLWRMR